MPKRRIPWEPPVFEDWDDWEAQRPTCNPGYYVCLPDSVVCRPKLAKTVYCYPACSPNCSPECRPTVCYPECSPRYTPK